MVMRSYGWAPLKYVPALSSPSCDYVRSWGDVCGLHRHVARHTAIDLLTCSSIHLAVVADLARGPGAAVWLQHEKAPSGLQCAVHSVSCGLLITVHLLVIMLHCKPRPLVLWLYLWISVSKRRPFTCLVYTLTVHFISSKFFSVFPLLGRVFKTTFLSSSWQFPCKHWVMT